MSNLKQWLCLPLTLALSIALILPAKAADPLASTFAAFLIDAKTTDAPELNLRVDLYRRDSSSTFQMDDSVRYDCSINRVAGQASFYIQPKTDGVWVEVDYLTDLDGDGVYEMLDGEDSPVCDSMTAGGALHAWDGTTHPLTSGQTYILSSKALSARGQAALNTRNTAGSAQAIPEAGGTLPSVDTVLYLVSLHYNSPVDQTEYVLYYYLRLFSSVIVPSDVPSGAWYYGAVEYTLEQGLFSGTGSNSFSPGGTVTRAQLAQILWRLGGSKQAENSSFPDVAESAWYYSAVSWCSQKGLMSGTGSGFLPNTPLTREQLALVLRQYAKYAGLDTETGTPLSGFTDGSSASVWAREGLEWAVAEGLLTGYDNGSLRPGSGITRCELAAVLRTFCQNLLDQ
ncbi:MAG: S-layer homology domain-containing protein [Lawsonibacter sp.]